MTGSATYIKTQISPTGAQQRLYKVEPPMTDEEGGEHAYVIVSAVYAFLVGPETYIFPATPDGDVTSFGELSGSLRGTLEHEEALAAAGYTVASPPPAPPLVSPNGFASAAAEEQTRISYVVMDPDYPTPLRYCGNHPELAHLIVEQDSPRRGVQLWVERWTYKVGTMATGWKWLPVSTERVEPA